MVAGFTVIGTKGSAVWGWALAAAGLAGFVITLGAYLVWRRHSFVILEGAQPVRWHYRAIAKLAPRDYTDLVASRPALQSWYLRLIQRRANRRLVRLRRYAAWSLAYPLTTQPGVRSQRK